MPKLKLEPLLEFYDNPTSFSSRLKKKDKDLGGVAKALNAMMGEELAINLLRRYAEKQGWEYHVASRSVTPGTQDGLRLDAWIRIIEPNSEKPYYYQMEIKNWSAHSFGAGSGLAVDAREDDVCAARMENWQAQFACTNGSQVEKIREESARKVLNSMFLKGYCYKDKEHYAEELKKYGEDYEPEMRPLICFWLPMHPGAEDDPFFKVSLKEASLKEGVVGPEEYDDTNRWGIRSGPFEELWVFSMSNYIRGLLKEGETDIEFRMKEVDKRLECINLIFS